MSRALKPATTDDKIRVHNAIVKLSEARDLLHHAGCLQSAKAVARAIKSAEGAYRHVRHRIRAAEEATP